MEAFAEYLLKSVTWLTGFAVVYFLFLRNERFFLLKRYYLITGIVVSVIFPLFSIHYQVEVPAAVVSVPPPSFSTEYTNIAEGRQISHNTAFNYNFLLLAFYLAGVLFFAFMMIRHIRALFKTIRKAKINSRGPAKLVRVCDFSSSFSFFNYVFINPKVTEAEVEEIMNHELVHVNQKHWFDLLLVELLRAFQWVNPFAWIYTGFIRLNHEYLADQLALERTSNPAIYRAALVNQILGSPVISLSNSFNYSLNKKRFDMMKTIITSPYRRLKVLLVLPVFAIVFYAFAKPEYHYTTPARNSDGASDPPEMTVNMQDDLDYQKEIVIRTGDGSELKALFVIDGVVSENGMKKVNPDAILSVSVLKDNAATDKYGEKGRNGVIEITTKPQSPVTPMPISQAVEISQKAVKGIIRKEDGQPLEGVEIMSTGTTGNSYHTTTGKDGRFEINNVPEDASLLFSCRGYKRLTLKADFGKEMTIKMETDPEYKAPAVQRPTPVVAIDGIISEKNFATASKELGYEMGPVKMLPVKEATDKYGEKGAGGVYEITTRTKALEMGIKVPLPRLAPADYPTFQGQPARSFNDWAAGQVSYPPEARAKQIEGWITVNFAVELDGTVTNVTPAGQTDPLLSEEVVRVIKNSPKWDPPKNPEVDSPFNSSFTIGFKLPDQVVKTPPYIVVEEMPMYPGGELELLKFIAMNTQYPEAAKAEGIEGRVIVRFIVNTEGNTEGITVLKGVHPLLDNEAIRVVSRMSGFRPGMQDGKAVNVWYMVPITFTLAKPNQP